MSHFHIAALHCTTNIPVVVTADPTKALKEYSRMLEVIYDLTGQTITDQDTAETIFSDGTVVRISTCEGECLDFPSSRNKQIV